MIRSLGGVVPGSGLRGFTREQLEYYHFGCGLDTTRMRTDLGFEPKWTSLGALDDMIRGAAARPVVSKDWLMSVESEIRDLVGVGEGAR